VRNGEVRDLEEIGRIQASCPEAAQWNVPEYPQYEFRVAELGGRVVGFLVWRAVAEGEREILNLAVAPEFRRQGVARQLITGVLSGSIYLEVRESNAAGRIFYNSIGFQEIAIRRNYYKTDGGESESAIVMKFHSC